LCGAGEKCQSGISEELKDVKVPSNSTRNRRMDIKVEHFFESDRRDARIYLAHDFVTMEECQVLKMRAEPRLAQAAVTGDSPGERVGECPRTHHSRSGSVAACNGPMT
jgi:hypothetical protein